MLPAFQNASVGTALLLFTVANFAIYGISIATCAWIGAVFHKRSLFEHPAPLQLWEILASIAAVIGNSFISVLGWMLWRDGHITLTSSGWMRSLWDLGVMIFVMDLGMYLFHRTAHWAPFYRWIHSFHHRHESTNPISLFLLHPVEVVGFGGLMIAFLCGYSMSLGGLLAYLGFNVAFGTLGHSGVEPFPSVIGKIPLLRWVGTSTFHAEHHETPHHNFGFYTLIWDKLFGTLDPRYEHHFAQGASLGDKKE